MQLRFVLLLSAAGLAVQPCSWAQPNPAQSFADVFASVLQAENPDGGSWGGAAEYLQVAGTPKGALEAVINQYRLLVVPGFLSACASGQGAFEQARQHLLVQHGVDAQYQQVPDDSCENNGKRLANYLRKQANGKKYIVVGHSKGAADLQVALQEPGVATLVAAFISVAGAVGGSHIADLPRAPVLIDGLEESLKCSGKLGLALQSLGTKARQAFNTSHPNPPVPSYSLVAVSGPLKTSLALVPTWWALDTSGTAAHMPTEQDGLLIAVEGILPGAKNLGAARADHVAVAHDFKGTAFSLVFNHGDFPRAALLEALLRFVVADLRSK
jgi:hypothetical protein